MYEHLNLPVIPIEDIEFNDSPPDGLVHVTTQLELLESKNIFTANETSQVIFSELTTVF